MIMEFLQQIQTLLIKLLTDIIFINGIEIMIFKQIMILILLQIIIIYLMVMV